MPESETSLATDIDACRVVVLLCTYNEAQNIPVVFEQLSEALPQADVLVVDDNSPDRTDEVVQKFVDDDSKYHLLRRGGKLGLGSATRDGLEWCLERDYDFIIHLDADLSHNPYTAVDLLVACVESDPAVDVAVGSRYVAGGSSPGLSWFRIAISRALNCYASLLLRLPLHDCSGSYRCYRSVSLRKLDLQQATCPGYGFLEEILVLLHRRGAQFVEVPIEYRSRMSGRSKLSFRDAWGALQVIHRLALQAD